MFKRKDNSTDSGKPAPGFITRLRARLNRGDSWLTYDLANLVPGGKIDEDLLEELETRLLLADVGVDATTHIMDGLRGRLKRKELKDGTAVIAPCARPCSRYWRPVSHLCI